MIERIHSREGEQVDFRDHLHARTRHVQHDCLATVLDGGTRGIDARHRNRASVRIPGKQCVKAGERQKRTPTICREHRDDRHVARLVLRESVDFFDLIGNRDHGDDHSTSTHSLDELARITGTSDGLFRAAIVVGETTRGRKIPSVVHRIEFAIPVRHEASLGGTITRVTTVGSRTRSTAVILTVVVLVASNLRIALSSLPAVATIIQAETGWNDALIGALTTVPVLAMGVFALGVPALAERIGRRMAVSLALATMGIALLLRLAGAFSMTLFASALLAGLAIAVIGGLVPGIVRDELSGSNGVAASLWTAALMGGAALGAVATVPLTELLGGWNRALAFWALPACIALIAWLWLERRPTTNEKPRITVRLRDLPWKNHIAWALTAMTTLNSIVFYSAIAWIAPSFQEQGFSAQTAGLFLGIFTGLHIAGALVFPAWSHRTSARRTLFVATIVSSSALILVVGFQPLVAPALILALLGFTLSGAFVMSLGLLSEYAADEAAAVRLTAMVFSVTFIVSSFGPFLAGIIMDVVGSWTLVYASLAIIVLLQLMAVPPLRKNQFIN